MVLHIPKLMNRSECWNLGENVHTNDNLWIISRVILYFILLPAVANKPTNNINYIRSNKYIFNEINISLHCDKSFTLIKLIASHHYNRTETLAIINIFPYFLVWCTEWTAQFYRAANI